VALDSDGLATFNSAPPAEFGGPGNQWSPETLLVAAVADCFIMTFTAIARASKLEWQSLECRVEGVLDRVNSVTQFTRYDISASLSIAESGDEAKAQHILEKSEAVCLITNSLKGEKSLQTKIIKI